MTINVSIIKVNVNVELKVLLGQKRMSGYFLYDICADRNFFGILASLSDIN